MEAHVLVYNFNNRYDDSPGKYYDQLNPTPFEQTEVIAIDPFY